LDPSRFFAFGLKRTGIRTIENDDVACLE